MNPNKGERGRGRDGEQAGKQNEEFRDLGHRCSAMVFK